MISIVIPALNEEKFLPDCLKSLKQQDYSGEYEIIVADNGSTDNTANIARDFGAKVIPCSEKKSVFYARRVGADAARGDIIIQADADTIYPRDWLQKIASQFEAHPEAVAVTGRFTYRDPPFWAKAEYALRSFWNTVTLALFRRPIIISGATFAFRRKAFLAVNGYEGLTYAADQCGIADRLRKVGRVSYDPDLRVLTSARSVKKPLCRILIDLMTHINRWYLYQAKCCLASWQVYTSQTRARRIAARALPVVVFIGLFASYGYFVPSSPVFGKVYFETKSPEKIVALTFDDGPNDPYSSQILDILAKYNVKATFFVIGKNVELYPETAKRMIAEGHVLGNHSYSHNANHALTQYGSNDLILAQEVIFNTVGVIPHLYRPPHGKKTPWELRAVRKEGLIEVTWSVSTRELGIKAPASKVAQRIINKVDPGEIILLHDGYGTFHNSIKSNKTLTVEALPLIIEQLQAKGYRFVTVPELLNMPAYNN